MNKGTAIVGFFLSFVAGLFLMWGVERSKNPSITAEPTAKGGLDHSAAAVPVSAKDPQWGNADAPVTIVEISDFECPFCSRVGPTMKQIKDTYGADKVRIVWKHNPLPFHKAARGAHEASQVVFALGGSDAFWKFHDLAFANQKELNDANYEKWAGQSGVDVAKFKAEYASKKHAAKVDEDLATGKKVGANGTPNFRVNGVEVSGAQPFDAFKKVIDEQLAEAQKLVAAGTKKGEVYVALTNKNAKTPPPAAAQPDKPQAPPEDTTVWAVPVFKDDPVKGPADALVTVVIWSDFQCPFCKKVEPTIAELVKTYGNDLRVVWKDNALPFHPRAKPAATLARVAYDAKGDKGFWDAHEALFESHPKLEDADLEAVAKKLGLEWTKVKAAIDANKYESKIAASMEQAQDVNAGGTPHFFINGIRLSGAQPVDAFKKVVDAQLAKAKGLVAGGTPRAKVYEEILKTGKGMDKKDVPAPGKDSPSKGGANAKVVLQLFSDFQCPFCGRVEPTLTELNKIYGDKLKIVWRDLPLAFHADAPLAAEAAREAYEQKGNAGFWKFHDRLFEEQKSADGVKRPTLEKIAQEMGLDMAKFKNALDTRKHKAKVDADAALAQKVGITGTPASVVNGYYLSGAQPIDKFRRIVDRAMKEAGVPVPAAAPAGAAPAPAAPKPIAQ
ncbi:MAG: thioredoxin domain-containing protein [Polyangiaceae bacterium]|nr:thioredoxin domain-containing protein [Polyangiaceae bacterium]